MLKHVSYTQYSFTSVSLQIGSHTLELGVQRTNCSLPSLSICQFRTLKNVWECDQKNIFSVAVKFTGGSTGVRLFHRWNRSCRTEMQLYTIPAKMYMTDYL